MAGKRAEVRIDKRGFVWGEGDELLDGTIHFIAGKYHYDTFRGKVACHERLSTVLTAVAKQLGYTGAVQRHSTRHAHG